MKISSDNYTKVNIVILIMSLLAIFTNVLLSFFQGSLSDTWYLGAGGILLQLILIVRGPSRFKYDTEGEVMNFTTEDPIWQGLFTKFKRHYEFPKRRLHAWKITGTFLRRKLTIYIKSRSGGVKERHMYISYLKRSELKKLRGSLNKYARSVKNGRRRKGTESVGATS